MYFTNRTIERNTASTPLVRQLMYYMDIRVVFRGAFPCLSSQSDGLNKYNSEILRQSPFVPPSCITYTLGGFTKGFFLVFHLKSVGGKTQIKLSPFPHVFGLRRLQSNPPRSLWLQHIHRMCCFTRRAHTAVHYKRVWVSRPTSTKQIIWRNCGRSPCPCSN